MGQGSVRMSAPSVHVLDLDGSIQLQRGFLQEYKPSVTSVRGLGERLRLAVSFGAFRRFCEGLELYEKCDHSSGRIVLFGSGDFHHVTLGLLSRLAEPVNLLLLDHHPDWMRHIPFMHCGSWLCHGLALPQVRRVYQVGSDTDFENLYYGLTPWSDLADGSIKLFPAVRRLTRGRWKKIPHEPLRVSPNELVNSDRLGQLLTPLANELAEVPLYISVDKDVLVPGQAVINWDSGKLTLDEITAVIRAFLKFAQGRLAGADIVGDWSDVRVKSPFAKALNLARPKDDSTDPHYASYCNEKANKRIVDCILGSVKHLTCRSVFAARGLTGHLRAGLSTRGYE